MNRTRGRMPFLALLAATVLTGWSGACSEAEFGESLRVRPTSRTAIDESIAPGDRLLIPRDALFGIADSQRTSTGAGQAESLADKNGSARCAARVAGAGAASAEFQLGHVIYSARSEPIDVVVTFDCAYAYELSGENLSANAPEVMGLKLYVQDSDKAMLHKEMLVSLDGPWGAAQRHGHEVVAVNLTLEPGLAYHLVAAGAVGVSAVEDAPGVEVAIELSEFSIDVVAR